MENRIARIEDKVDVIVEKQAEFAVQQAELAAATRENTESLKEHMAQTVEVRKQTQLLFEGMVLIKDELNRRDQIQAEALNKRLKPTEQFIDRAKFLGICLGLLLSAALAVLKSGILHI